MFTERMSIRLAQTERGEKIKLRFIERLRVVRDASGEEQVTADPPTVSMLNGAEVAKLEEGVYQVVETGERLSLIDNQPTLSDRNRSTARLDSESSKPPAPPVDVVRGSLASASSTGRAGGFY